GLSRSWWPDELRTEPSRSVSPVRRLHRPHAQWRKAGRASGAGTDEIRVGDQPRYLENARSNNSARASRCRRRGDRVTRRAFISLLGGAAVAFLNTTNIAQRPKKNGK